MQILYSSDLKRSKMKQILKSNISNTAEYIEK